MDGWTNYTSSTTGAAGNLISGRGYQMATTAAATGAEVTFDGTLLTARCSEDINYKRGRKCFS